MTTPKVPPAAGAIQNTKLDAFWQKIEQAAREMDPERFESFWSTARSWTRMARATRVRTASGGFCGSAIPASRR